MIDYGYQLWIAPAGASAQGAGARRAIVRVHNGRLGSDDPRPGRARTTGPMTRQRALATRILTLVGIVGPIYYIGFVTLLGLLWAGYDPIRQTQSELGAVGAPHGLLMNVAGFMALGIVILAFAAAYHLVLRPGPWKLAATVLMAVAGAGMIVVGFFPCDAGCVDVTRTSELHSTFSMPGAIGLPAAALLSSLAFRDDGRLGPAWQVASFLLGLAALASGPIIAADILPDQLGLLQRAAMWTPVLWMSAVTVRLSALARAEGGAVPASSRAPR
jgi:hypothetical protein